jgi:hypothetical protein
MKRLTILALTMVLALRASSQGWFDFNNYNLNGSPMAPIYGPEPGNPGQMKWGNAPDAHPAGAQTYSGPRLAGSNYSAQAWYSLTPVSDIFALDATGSAVVASLTTFLTGPDAGFFSGGQFIVPCIFTNGWYGVYLQVRAWDNGGGQYNSWTAAWNAAMTGSGKAVGWSKVFWQPVNPGLGLPDGLYNFESFNVFIVPEPSIFSLFSVGAMAWLTLRRRKHGG